MTHTESMAVIRARVREKLINELYGKDKGKCHTFMQASKAVAEKQHGKEAKTVESADIFEADIRGHVSIVT